MTRPENEPFKKPGKYRRAFDWRLSHGQDPLSRDAAGGMGRLASSDYLDILEDFLAISRKRQRNPTALAKLQIYMIEELLLQENASKHYRQRIKELETSGSPADPEQHKEETDFNKRVQFFHRMYANAIRAIGDGIAWRALGYDRAVTRLLGERETHQHLSAEGTVPELREWSYQFDSGSGIAILNALTNCLAIGDITVVRNDGSAEIIEVKSSNTKSGRKVRQKQAMSEVVTLLDSGKGENESREVQIEVLPIRPESSLDKVEELLDAAAVTGRAVRRINDCLYVEAFDFRKMSREENLQDAMKVLRKQAIGEWEERGDLIIDMNSLDAVAYTPNCAPFSIFPFRSRTCIELLVGARFFKSFLNLSAIEREFTRRGWTLEKDFKVFAEAGSTESVLKVRKGPFHCTVPPSDLMRLQMETLRPKTLIDALECKFREGPSGDQGYLLALYAEESKLWN